MWRKGLPVQVSIWTRNGVLTSWDKVPDGQRGRVDIRVKFRHVEIICDVSPYPVLGRESSSTFDNYLYLDICYFTFYPVWHHTRNYVYGCLVTPSCISLVRSFRSTSDVNSTRSFLDVLKLSFLLSSSLCNVWFLYWIHF